MNEEDNLSRMYVCDNNSPILFYDKDIWDNSIGMRVEETAVDEMAGLNSLLSIDRLVLHELFQPNEMW